MFSKLFDLSTLLMINTIFELSFLISFKITLSRGTRPSDASTTKRTKSDDFIILKTSFFTLLLKLSS